METPQTLFLQSKLPGYRCFRKQNVSLFIKGLDDPAFCLLPKWQLLGSRQKYLKLTALYPKIVWIISVGPFSSCLIRPKLLKAFQPLYFLCKNARESFEICDKRYLKTNDKLHGLPFVSVDLGSAFQKSADLQTQEDLLFYPTRTLTFHFKGDTTDRIQSSSYLKALEEKQIAKRKRLSSCYLFLKKQLDS